MSFVERLRIPLAPRGRARAASLGALLGLSAAALACGDRDPAFTTDRLVEGPLAAGTSLAWLERGADTLRTLDLETGTSHRIAAGRKPARAIPIGGAASPRLAVVDGGTRPGLTLLDLSTPGATPRSLALAKAFNAVHVAPGGTHLVLRFDVGASSADTTAGLSASEYEIVAADGSSAVHRAVDAQSTGLGAEVRDVVFAPPMACGPTAALAALVLPDGLLVIDYAHPEIEPRKVPTSVASGVSFAPAEVVFSKAAADIDAAGRSRCWAFVRLAGLADVLALTLTVDPAGPSIAASVNFLDAGTSKAAGDLETFADPSLRDKVLALYPDAGVVALLQADSLQSEQRVVSVDAGEAERATLLRAGGAGGGAEVALLWSAQGRRVHVFDPLRGELATRAAPQQVRTGVSVAPGAPGRALIVLDAGQSANHPFALVRVSRRASGSRLDLAVEPRAAGLSFADAAFSGDGRRLYLASARDSSLAILDLDLGTTALVPLDHRPSSLGAVSTAAGELVWVASDDPFGRVTVLGPGAEVGDFDRAHSTVHSGFLLSDVTEVGR